MQRASHCTADLGAQLQHARVHREIAFDGIGSTQKECSGSKFGEVVCDDPAGQIAGSCSDINDGFSGNHQSCCVRFSEGQAGCDRQDLTNGGIDQNPTHIGSAGTADTQGAAGGVCGDIGGGLESEEVGHARGRGGGGRAGEDGSCGRSGEGVRELGDGRGGNEAEHRVVHNEVGGGVCGGLGPHDVGGEDA